MKRTGMLLATSLVSFFIIVIKQKFFSVLIRPVVDVKRQN